jgi:DNA-binding response OmpR family regulator
MTKRVLVVDDDADVRGLVVKALKAKAYDVVEASDGLKASELLGQLAPLPDLLICDVMMPTIDGFSLARLVRARPELKAIPIIFLTAKASTVDVVQGIQLGARHYIQKPFSIKDLLGKVEKLLRVT